MKKTTKEVAIGKLTLSRFNSRHTRLDDDVERLAERIKQNGFEPTRALWVYGENEHYEVFAGGTRFEASKLAKLKLVPCILHSDCTDDEIALLSDLDNENDEYHRPVPLVDVWAEYHRLATEEEWEQKRIAAAKGTDETTARLRIHLHELLCDQAKQATVDGLFEEGHCVAIIGVTVDVHGLHAWLTTDQSQTELVEEVLGKHRGSSAGIKPTVKVVRDAAKRWKSLIDAVVTVYEQLDGDDGKWQKEFVHLLTKRQVRTQAGVGECRAVVLSLKKLAAEEAAQIARQKAEEQDKAALEAERERKRQEAINDFTSRILLGDARQRIKDVPDGITLLLTDPPYGIDFQSQRRKVTDKKAAMRDDQLQAALALLVDVLRKAFKKMCDDATLLVFSGWRHEPQFRKVIQAAGFEIRGSLVWVKNNHGTGDLKGAFAPKHERIIHATKGAPELNGRPDDVLHGKDRQDSDHPTEKPLDLLRMLIKTTTKPHDLVVDPFAGSGNVLFAAHQEERSFYGIEIDDKWHSRISDKLLEIIKDETDE